MQRKVRYEELFPSEFKEILEKAPIAYVPFGFLEWHGTHLPLGVDTIRPYHICQEACKRSGGIVFPPTVWWSDENWLGTFGGISREIIRQLALNVFDAVQDEGFRVLVVLVGHGPQRQFFQDLVEQYRQEKVPLSVAEATEKLSPLKVGGRPLKAYQHPEAKHTSRPRCAMRVWCGIESDAAPPDWGWAEDYKSPLGHAGKYETSVIMAIRPDLVDLGRIECDDVGGIYKDCLFRSISDDPRGEASAELGRQYLDGITENLARIALALLDEARGEPDTGGILWQAPKSSSQEENLQE